MNGVASYTAGFSSPGERPTRGTGRRRRLKGPIPRLRLPASVVGGARRVARAGGLRALRGVAGAVTREQRLLQRVTMGWNETELIRIGELGFDAYLEGQLDYEAIDDGWLEDLLAQALPTLAMSPAQIYARQGDARFASIFELIVAALYRAIYSPRQLYERMVVFWSDHFNIDLFSDLGFLLKPTDDREVIRRHALGNFRDLLRASAHSPAMLVYLTNDSNVKGHPNENYSRELMELHTLGADKGYSQDDVKEVARCFTGWRVQGRAAGDQLGRFLFDAASHDEGAKSVLGRAIPAGRGEEDGNQVIDILARDRRTAKFVGKKLLRYFWGYEPGRKMVNQVANAFQSSGGDIRTVLRSVLRPTRIDKATPKLKRPFHLTVSALRALEADLENPRFVLEAINGAGHLPFAWPPPNGYPDSQGYWSGFVLPRWNFAADLPFQKKSGARLNVDFLDESLPPARLVQRIDNQLFNGTMSEETSAALQVFLEAKPVTRKRIREAVGLALGSPDFQSY